MVVAGGVAANKSVRAAMSSCAARRGVVMHCPPPRLCVDNGVMVAWSGVERLHLNLWYALHSTALHKENKPTLHKENKPTPDCTKRISLHRTALCYTHTHHTYIQHLSSC
jgi:N6-L-threonylcarbamoyladenine synthase